MILSFVSSLVDGEDSWLAVAIATQTQHLLPLSYQTLVMVLPIRLRCDGSLVGCTQAALKEKDGDCVLVNFFYTATAIQCC